MGESELKILYAFEAIDRLSYAIGHENTINICKSIYALLESQADRETH